MSSDDADAAGTATTKTGSAGVLLPGNSDSATAAAKSSTNPGAQTLDSAFQQVMNHVSKDNDKENSSSALNATITNNVISAASSAQTPTSTSTVSAPATPLLNSQLGSPEWQQALGQQILMFSRNGQQTAELHLHPQDLGSIQISLKLDNDQAQLSMVSNHSQVRAPRLRPLSLNCVPHWLKAASAWVKVMSVAMHSSRVSPLMASRNSSVITTETRLVSLMKMTVM
ncbi:flagellar hook-length control protein FliK [Erwinia aphidicola]